MKQVKLQEMTVNQLVDRFAEIGIAQYDAAMGGALTSYLKTPKGGVQAAVKGKKLLFDNRFQK